MHLLHGNLTRGVLKSLRPYAVAMLSIAVALSARATLHPFLQAPAPSMFMAYTTFMVATAFCAWFLGWGPGLLAIGLGLIVGDFFFTPPLHSLTAFSRNALPETITYLVASVLFLLVGIAKQKRTALLVERSRQLQDANKRLRITSARLLRAQDEERRKIARELHDSVGQFLTALSMTVGDVARGLKESPANVGEKLGEAQSLISSCTSEVRTISYLLHPPLLDELGLASAVRWYVEGFSTRSGIDVQLNVPEHLERVGDDAELALFRVLQEALTNVHRHSGSRVASVRIGSDQRQVWLEVEDQGRGISGPRSVPPRVGVGISGMRERVRDLSGLLEVKSDRRGTLVKAVIPIANGSQTVSPINQGQESLR